MSLTFGSAPRPYAPFINSSCASAVFAGNGDAFASSANQPRGKVTACKLHAFAAALSAAVIARNDASASASPACARCRASLLFAACCSGSSGPGTSLPAEISGWSAGHLLSPRKSAGLHVDAPAGNSEEFPPGGQMRCQKKQGL